MQLKRYTDYSLRVLISLACDPDRIISINEMAETYDISRNHLLKVVSGLVGLGLIETHRGKSGGLKLARPAKKINIGEVVRHMEGSVQVIDCHTPHCKILPACELKSALDEAHQAFYDSLRRYTLEDLIRGKETRIRRLLVS